MSKYSKQTVNGPVKYENCEYHTKYNKRTTSSALTLSISLSPFRIQGKFTFIELLIVVAVVMRWCGTDAVFLSQKAEQFFSIIHATHIHKYIHT